MRVGLAVSLAAHAAILAAGFLALPDAEPFAVEAIEALPVDLVRLADMTELRAGDREAEPEAPPQPKPQAKAPAPAPEVAETPAETPVKAAREPAPRPVRDVTQQPKPDAAEPEEAQPASEPVEAARTEPEPPAPAPPEPKHVAALPRAAEPAPTPEPEQAAGPEPPAIAPTPRMRPKPPRAQAPQPEVARAEPPKPPKPEPEPEFDPNDIAALLDKREPRGGGDPEPAAEPRSFGVDDGAQEAPMTQSELAALQARLYQCWNPPIGVREAGNLQVTIGIYLGPDGQLSAQPRVVAAGGDALSRIAAESAMRAVQICAPYDFLPQEKYAQWREIEFTFDPREMLGG